MEKMSLLQEIQSDTVNPNADISTILRKCHILSSKLGNKELELWVEHELNGYSPEDELPEYRIMRHMESFGDFVGRFGSGGKSLPIAPSNIPEEWREMVTTIKLAEPVSSYELLVKRESDTSIRWAWHADLIKLAGSKIWTDMNCVSAWIQVPMGAISALVETVKNKVLKFVLEIEKEAPNAGEATPGTQAIPEERVHQVVQTIIYGDVKSIAAGSQITTHTYEVTVVQNDLESLKEYLNSIGINKKDIGELEKAINEDSKINAEKVGIGTHVNEWIRKTINKAVTGTGKVVVNVAANTLIQAILQYYGIMQT